MSEKPPLKKESKKEKVKGKKKAIGKRPLSRRFTRATGGPAVLTPSQFEIEPLFIPQLTPDYPEEKLRGIIKKTEVKPKTSIKDLARKLDALKHAYLSKKQKPVVMENPPIKKPPVKKPEFPSNKIILIKKPLVKKPILIFTKKSVTKKPDKKLESLTKKAILIKKTPESKGFPKPLIKKLKPVVVKKPMKKEPAKSTGEFLKLPKMPSLTFSLKKSSKQEKTKKKSIAKEDNK